MAKLADSKKAAFYKAQGRVSTLLRPFLGRNILQMFDSNNAIEQYVVYSKEEDAGDGRHKWRGIVTINYQYPRSKGEPCSVQVSFSEDMVAHAMGHKIDATWEGTENILDKVIPPL